MSANAVPERWCPCGVRSVATVVYNCSLTLIYLGFRSVARGSRFVTLLTFLGGPFLDVGGVPGGFASTPLPCRQRPLSRQPCVVRGSIKSTASFAVELGTRIVDSVLALALPDMAAATNILTPTEASFLAEERAENIALLRVLKELPSRPKANQPPRAVKAEDRRRQLTLEDEKRLASALAFLAGISNDPNSVMAVCLEEIPRTSSIRVLIAINMERPPNGAELLEIARQGLEQVFDALTQSHAGKAAPDEEDSQGELTHDRPESGSRTKSPRDNHLDLS